MITGDARQVANAVGQELGIDEVFAEVLPQDKDTRVLELQGRGLSVAMVGDGVHDAPALAWAGVGVAIGVGTDVAMESVGVVLSSDDARAVVSMIELSRASYRKAIQNLVWASACSIVAVRMAAGVLAPISFILAPIVTAGGSLFGVPQPADPSRVGMSAVLVDEPLRRAHPPPRSVSVACEDVDTAPGCSGGDICDDMILSQM